MNQHYEWVKATPDNLPKDVQKLVLIAYTHEGENILKRLFVYQLEALIKYGYGNNRFHEIEYLAEVAPIEWPGDEESNQGFTDFMSKLRNDGNYEPWSAPGIWKAAVTWLKQVTINKSDVI